MLYKINAVQILVNIFFLKKNWFGKGRKKEYVLKKASCSKFIMFCYISSFLLIPIVYYITNCCLRNKMF